MKKMIYVFCSAIFAGGVFWLLYAELNISDPATVSTQKDIQLMNYPDKISDQNDVDFSFPANVSDTNKHQIIHQPNRSEKPEFEPLNNEQRQQYIEQKNHSEKQIKDIMQKFADNLDNRETRIQLEAEMQVHTKEYKQAMLKLGKEMLEKENDR